MEAILLILFGAAGLIAVLPKNAKRKNGRSDNMQFELDGVVYDYRSITNKMLDEAKVIRWISGDPDKRNYKRLDRYKHKISNWNTLRFLDKTIF